MGSDWKGDERPECTYVMKDGENLQEYLSIDPTPVSSAYPSAPASPPVSDAQEEQSDLEESEKQFPQPPNSEEEPVVRICWYPAPRPYQGVRPDWWTPAWEKLNGCLTNANIPLLPVSPKDFKEAVQSDVWMIDRLGAQHVTDPATGMEIGPESDPRVMCTVTGCNLNSNYVTLIKKGAKGASTNTMVLE
jgi:hypothetical protein